MVEVAETGSEEEDLDIVAASSILLCMYVYMHHTYDTRICQIFKNNQQIRGCNLVMVGSGVGFQTASMVSLEGKVYKIQNRMHNFNDLSFGCLVLHELMRWIIIYLILCHLI